MGWINKQMNEERIVCKAETLTEPPVTTDLGSIPRLSRAGSRTPWAALSFRIAAQMSHMLTLPSHPCHTQSCLTLSDPTDCSSPGSSVHGILQARTPVWVAISSSGGSSWCRDRTCIFCWGFRTLGREQLLQDWDLAFCFPCLPLRPKHCCR